MSLQHGHIPAGLFPRDISVEGLGLAPWACSQCAREGDLLEDSPGCGCAWRGSHLEQDQVLCLERCCTKLPGQKQERDKHGTSSPRGQQPSGEEMGTGSTFLPHPSCSLLVCSRLLTQRTINHNFLEVFCSHISVSRKGPAHLW